MIVFKSSLDGKYKLSHKRVAKPADDYGEEMMNFKYRKIIANNIPLGILGPPLLLLLSYIFPTMPCQAEIYMQTTASGMIQFSDHPKGASSPVMLRKINSYSPGNNTLVAAATDPAPKLKIYDTVTVRTPKEAQTFQNQSQIPVHIEIMPSLNAKDKIEIWLDDNLYQRGNETQTTLQNLARGEHSVQIKIINAEGKLLNASSVTTFYVHRAFKSDSLTTQEEPGSGNGELIIR